VARSDKRWWKIYEEMQHMLKDKESNRSTSREVDGK